MTADRPSNGRTETLLDASDSRRRLLQQGLVVAGAIAVASSVAATRVAPRWEVDYHGHVVRFEYHGMLGQRLVIDGERITRGAQDYRKALEGTIRRGSRAGTRIRAEFEAGLIRFRCRITAERAQA